MAEKSLTTNVFLSISKSTLGEQAGTELLDAIKPKISEKPSLILLYATNDVLEQYKLLKKLYFGLDKVLIVGGTVDGIMTSEGYIDSGVAALVIESPFIFAGGAYDEGLSTEGITVGLHAAIVAWQKMQKNIILALPTYISHPELLISKGSPVVSLVFGAATPNVPQEDLYKSIIYLSNYTPLIGAVIDTKKSNSFLYFNDKLLSNSIIVIYLFLLSNLGIGVGIDHGYDLTGKYAVITRASGEAVFELDGIRAIDKIAELYETNTKDISANLEFYRTYRPLGIPTIDGFLEPRKIERIGNNGEIYISGKVPSWSVVHILSPKNILKGTERSIQYASRIFEEKSPSFGLVFNSVHRKTIIKENIEREGEIISRYLKDMPYIGVYSEGQVCYFGEGTSVYHTNTVVSAIVGKTD
ncbi:MAG: FIST N-terminal domain-containing protein [Candidatus Njordarchaeum guaymaensis]